jgi:hypothetical protein
MKTLIPPKNNMNHGRQSLLGSCFSAVAISGLVCLAGANSRAATLNLFTNSFDSFTDVATNFTDNANANPPTVTGPNSVRVVNDRANATPLAIGSFGANGVQVINWDSASAPNSILIRPGAIVNCNIYPRGGTNYIFEWKMKTMKSDGSDRGFRISLRSQGADINDDGTDFVIFRTIQSATTNAANSGIEGVDGFQVFNGIQGSPGANSWVTITNSTTNEREQITSGTWNSYKVVADSVGRTFALYINGNLVNDTIYCARPVEMVVSGLRFENEGANNKDYYLIDDVSLTVEGTFIDLNTTFTEGFESYPAATSPTDDADPQGAWIVGETAGTGANVAFTPGKVQVVDTEARSGSKSLKLEGGQIAGATIPWGQMPNRDVRVRWWQKVPATAGGNSLYLRVSLYGFEARLSTAADGMLLGSGSRSSAPLGGPTSLMSFNRLVAPGNGAWLDTLEQFTADTWEEFELTTDLKHNTFTVVKNPSGTPVVVMEDYPFIAGVPMHNPYMIGFSSSNGSGHPPVYIDDITIESFDNEAPPLPRPYTPVITGNRFTNYTVLTVPGHLVGGVAVDPRDNTSIIFTTMEAEVGTIQRAQKVAAGNWQLDAAPLVTALDLPRGITVETNGTIWWVHDNIQSLRRLKAPWASNPVEEIISDFTSENNVRDQPIDLTFFVTNGVTTLAVLDRNANNVLNRNAIYAVDPTTTTLNQVGYTNYLVEPSTTILGEGVTGPANAIASLPATGELVTTLQADGWISVIGDTGVSRYIGTFAAGMSLARGIAVDPTTSRIWVSGNDLLTPTLAVTNQVWSFDSNTGAEIQELEFPRINPSEARPDRRVRFAEGGMTFAPDGSFLVISDQSYLSGGGRLIIFHNEQSAVAPVTITNVTRTGTAVNLTWTSGGDVNYVVWRSATVNGTYGPISGVLTATQYTDSNSPADGAFYRVQIIPQD